MHERLQAAGSKEASIPEALPWEGGRGGTCRDSDYGEGGASGSGGGGADDSEHDHRAAGEIAAFHAVSEPTEEALQHLEMQLKAIPSSCLEMCRDTLNKRNEVLTWFSELDSSRSLLDDEMRAKLDVYRREGEASDGEMEAARDAQLGAVETALGMVRALASGAEAVRAAHDAAMQQLQQQHAAQAERADGEEQQREQDRASQVSALEASLAQAHERAQVLEAQLGAARAELHAAERRACAATDEAVAEHERFRIVTDQLAVMDGYLKGERQHMRELETRLTADEARVQKVNAQMSNLEEQLRVRDAAHQQRMQQMAEETMAQREAAKQLEAQKEALERRVQDLGALLAGKDGGDANALSQTTEQREEMERELEKERDLRRSVQKELERERERIAALEERAARATESPPSAASSSDDGAAALALAQELEGMQQQLRDTLQKVAEMEEERLHQEEAVRKLEARQREREETQKRSAELSAELSAGLSAELAAKEEALRDLREARAQAQAQRERVALLERQLMAARTTRPLEKALQQQHVDFQKKVGELQNALKEVVRHNDELERAVVQKQQEVEQRERVMREQAKVLKVRDELIVLLKGKEQRQEDALEALRDALARRDDDTDKLREEVSAKADEVRRAKEAVEAQHAQAAELQALVQQLEEQQERSQAQRTRQEARISSLERLLQQQAEQPPPAPAPPAPLPPADQPPATPSSPQQPPQRYAGTQGADGADRGATFFFWDGSRLAQIPRIPPGAADAPAAGTFYLTVSPKPKDQRAPSATAQFYVTAHIGAHDVEHGLSPQRAQDALAGAAMTCAAFAAARSGLPAHTSPPAPVPGPRPQSTARPRSASPGPGPPSLPARHPGCSEEGTLSRRWSTWTDSQPLAARADSPSSSQRSSPAAESDAEGASSDGAGGSGRGAPWIAFRSHMPATSERAAHSYVTLPDSDYSKEQVRPQDLARGGRLPLRSDPPPSPTPGADSQPRTPDATGARLHWGLPTIDEVNSEAPSRRASDEDTPEDDDGLHRPHATDDSALDTASDCAAPDHELACTPNHDPDSSAQQAKHTIRKCYTVFTSSNRSIPDFSLGPDVPVPEKLDGCLSPYHKTLSGIICPGNTTEKTDSQAWKQDQLNQRNQNSSSNVRHASDTTVISSQEAAAMQISATLFDIQRTPEASDSSINSSCFEERPISSSFPKNDVSGERHQSAGNIQASCHIHGFSSSHDVALPRRPNGSDVNHLATNTSHYYKENEHFSHNHSATNKTRENSPALKLPNPKFSNPQSKIQRSRSYKPMRNILSKSHNTPDRNEKFNIPNTRVGSGSLVRRDNCPHGNDTRITGNLEAYEYRNTTRPRPRSAPQSVSLSRYPANQTENTEESDTLSETSYNLDQNIYDTEDSYDADIHFAYHDPIFLSMQCLEPCDCHANVCKHVHW